MKTYQISDFLKVQASGSLSINHDGSLISFLNNASGTHQLYLISSEGIGKDDDHAKAEQLTSYDGALDFALFSPTKNQIIYGKDKGGDEQVQFYLYDLETKSTKALTDNPKIKHSFGSFSRDGKFISFSHNGRNGTDFDVYLMNMETGESHCVFDKGGDSHSAGFSPDRSYLLVRTSNTNTDKDLYLITLDAEGRKTAIEHINAHEGSEYFGGASWLPDESGFFTRTDKGRDFRGLSFFDIGKKEFAYIMTPDWDVNGCTISLDGKYLAVQINEDGYEKLRLFDISNNARNADNFIPVPLTGLSEETTITSCRFSRDSKNLIVTTNDSRHATNIWMYSIDEKKSWPITNTAQGVLPEDLVEPALFRYESFDGLSVPAFLYLPKNPAAANNVSDEKVPVIIHIHGGPESQFQPNLALLIQYFVYQGYAVIAPNVRGGAGYGKKYLAMDDVEKRLDSVSDIASLHDHIKTMPELDANKVVLMGGSYGGYMTLAGLAFHPDRWVGGIDVVGIANFVTFLENTASYRRAIREAEYGSLATDRQLLHDISPINHIEKIKAPLFVIHGANDPRVPLNEAEQIVEKITAQGGRAELLVYHDEGHGLSKLKNRLDAYPKVAEFLKGVFGK